MAWAGAAAVRPLCRWKGWATGVVFFFLLQRLDDCLRGNADGARMETAASCCELQVEAFGRSYVQDGGV
jgi:hypothetical protein